MISTGGFGYPKEEGIRIAVDEINAFLLHNDMLIYLVVFDTVATMLGTKLYPDLEAYIEYHYVEEKLKEEYSAARLKPAKWSDFCYRASRSNAMAEECRTVEDRRIAEECRTTKDIDEFDFEEQHESRLEERLKHSSDTFSEYLMA